MPLVNAKPEDKSLKGKLMIKLSMEDINSDFLEAEKRLDYELALIRKAGLEQYILAFENVL